MKIIISLLNKEASKKCSALFTTQELKTIILNSKLKIDDVDEMIRIINDQNYILQKGNKLYQLQTSQYT